MKPEPYDIRHQVLISGDELKALHRVGEAIAEAFGLERKIEKYKGTRPLTLLRWDLECLIDIIDDELATGAWRPEDSASNLTAMKSLAQRLRQEYDHHYGDEDRSQRGGS